MRRNRIWIGKEVWLDSPHNGTKTTISKHEEDHPYYKSELAFPLSSERTNVDFLQPQPDITSRCGQCNEIRAGGRRWEGLSMTRRQSTPRSLVSS
ncbi:hypothetical protein I7I53_07647 [Histoplasma capsulatum var. duboisii H88]|uniref:Uncharacterized protein n=1 Tax=Ajellomyces capsulatus (strain H88) TaxID=544711 RepID=A0A8A1LDI8_AJEC8|nr:hypothetical protein I7I53_07647 [Histoplasma capsulatum var. duboisii H88]